MWWVLGSYVLTINAVGRYMSSRYSVLILTLTEVSLAARCSKVAPRFRFLQRFAPPFLHKPGVKMARDGASSSIRRPVGQLGGIRPAKFQFPSSSCHTDCWFANVQAAKCCRGGRREKLLEVLAMVGGR